MRNEINLRKALLILGLIFTIFSIYNILNIQEENAGTIEIQNQRALNGLKKSGFWITNFIHVDGNWTHTVGNYSWCSGDGSWGNPYIIENVTIDASSSPTGSGIFINNSRNNYFIIRNCTVYNAGGGSHDAGIRLEDTNNGTLTNNNCSNNHYNGIMIYDECNNNIVSENILNDNIQYGIWLRDNCSDNTISKNTAGNDISTNQNTGIHLSLSCFNNTISGNTANNNIDHGFLLSNGCTDNLISGNIANYNSRGIYIVGSDCRSNTASGNTVNENIYGIYLSSARNNIISGNTANKNAYGIYLSSDRTNIISGNTIVENSQNGIYLENSQTNTISENVITNSQYGILFYYKCKSNIISGNTISRNQYGIFAYVVESATCELNIISGNTVTNNQYGMYFDAPYASWYFGFNTIKGNKISNNVEYGIYLYRDADFNDIYLNDFIGNGHHAKDISYAGNQWDDGYVGNYWDNYTGYDAFPFDGIGKIPHIFPWNIDTKPLTYLVSEDTDNDGLKNFEEYSLGDDGYHTNPVDPDSDDDSFNDGNEAECNTNPLDPLWYPMPNLKIMHFSSIVALKSTSFTLDFSITNDGLWKAEGVVAIVRCEELGLTLINNTNSPFNIEVDETEFITIGCNPFENIGDYTLNLTVNPHNTIAETYSMKNGSLRSDWELDNSMKANLSIIFNDEFYILLSYLDGNATLVQKLLDWLKGNSSLIDTIIIQLQQNATLIQQVIGWLGENATEIEQLFTYLHGNATQLIEVVNYLEGNATQIGILNQWYTKFKNYIDGNATLLVKVIFDLETNATLLDTVYALATQNANELSQINGTLSGRIDDIKTIIDALGITIGDMDYDGLNDLDELSYGTNPAMIDTDLDNLNDAFEIKYGTDPLDDDSDDDGHYDGIELASGNDPMDPDDYPGKITPTGGVNIPLLIGTIIGIVSAISVSIVLVIYFYLRKRKME